MESSFLTFVLVSSFVVSSSHTGIPDQDDVVVAREGTPTTLICTDRTARGAVTINWKVKSFGADEWKLVLFASESKEFSGAALKPSMELTDPNFQDTGVFSLSFLPKMEDSGLYSCLIKQQERKLKERIILLAILKVTVVPAAPVLQLSTLRLIASVNPESAISRITWAAPGGVPMKSERHPNTGTVAKLPRVQTSDSGAYVCIVQTQGNNSKSLFAFNVDVTVDADNTASFTNVTHGPTISTATQAQIPFIITCPFVQGDFVLLWKQPSGATRHSATQPMYQYDRWRAPTKPPERSKKLQLAGPPYNKDTGSFAFQLTPEPKDGGLYICDVYLNDNAFSQRTLLSVLKVTTRRSRSKLELQCTYTELSQVQSAKWRYQDTSRQLHPFSTSPGRISIILPMPITSDSAGNYTCTLQLKNGQTIWATQAVTLPQESGSVTTPSPPPPSLFALLLLVPLVAAAVSVLLWRQKHISDRGIEQSLSGHSGEVENIYENPEDIRQAPPEGSVYMDLKPRGEDDVYKELERCEQCQS